jgi:ferredoxin
MAEAIYKYNNGNGALLCSGCRVIIREGKDFTEKDEELMLGILKGDKVEAQYCEDCEKNT